jgi:hypothetical protein
MDDAPIARARLSAVLSKPAQWLAHHLALEVARLAYFP